MATTEERLDELVQMVAAALDRSARIVHLDEEATMIRRLMRSAGRPFTLSETGQTDGGGLLTVTIPGPPQGQTWRLEAARVSIGGASAAALVSAYLNDENDERNFIGRAPALVAGPPASGGIDWLRPVPIWHGVRVRVRISGAVGGQQVALRYWGVSIDTAEIQGHLGIQPPPVDVGQV